MPFAKGRHGEVLMKHKKITGVLYPTTTAPTFATYF
jgi:hypothetical protein